METLLFITLGIALACAACWSRARFTGFLAQGPDDYADGQQFDIRQHLNGPMVCEGVIYGPTGRVSSRFVANFDISWDGNDGAMKEHFRYDDGTTRDRAWQLTVDDEGRILAKANDVVGVGEGIQKGSAVRLKYRFRLPDDAGGHILDTVDWMYLAPNGAIVNRSQFRKFGFKVAELVATMRPAPLDMGQAA
ncbi:MAG: DUF3833 family protein [Paracoccaceae bacterium]